MRIATWNVNSVRARIANVSDWLQSTQPDVLLLQEIKCEADAFPRLEFDALGYKSYVVGQKSYNGVAIISRIDAEDVIYRLHGNDEDSQARYIEATISGIRIASIYLPNGNPIDSEKFPYKLEWIERLTDRAKSLLKREMPVVLGGDFNVIPTAYDVYDPESWKNDALFHSKTLSKYRKLINLGLTDAFRTLHHYDRNSYTFWDYQAGAWQRDNGLRIDHFLLSPEATDKLVSCSIDRISRSKDKASDHAPVIIDLN